MAKIWCSISGHGFGHAAQVVPVLNELGRRRPNLQVYLRTTLPATFFKETLTVSWELSPAVQDVGCIQKGPLWIDTKKTWEAYRCFHQNWDDRLHQEIEAIQKVQPQCVLSNITYLGIAAGVKADRPTIALASLSWDQVLEDYRSKGNVEQTMIIEHIRQSYSGTHKLIRPTPGIPMVAFSNIQDVGPIVSPKVSRVSRRGTIRYRLGLNPNDRIVVVAFGGIPLPFLPLEQLDDIKGYHFLITHTLDLQGYQRVTATHSIELSFREILRDADIIMTKPGYATIVEAVRDSKPIVYVRRYNFADEQPLVDYAHQYGRAVEMSRDEFNTGEWKQALEQVQRLPFPRDAIPCEGTKHAADLIDVHL